MKNKISLWNASIILMLFLFNSAPLLWGGDRVGLRSQVIAEFTLGFSDTNQAVIDSVSRHIISNSSNTIADTAKQYQIIWYSSADLYISSSPSFPAKNTFTLRSAAGGITDWKWFSADVPNWYYKAVSGSATVEVKIKCWTRQTRY